MVFIRNSLTAGDKTIINKQLVAAKKIILSPFHIKLGYMKQYVKALDVNGEYFKYICYGFPGLSEQKRADIFNGLHIRQLQKEAKFVSSIISIEARA